MSPPAPQRKPAARGPRYYRTPPVWGLVFIFLLVLLLIWFLFRLG